MLGLTVDARAADMAKTVDHVIPVPDTHPLLLPSLDVVPMQLFAYYVALQAGCDIRQAPQPGQVGDRGMRGTE